MYVLKVTSITIQNISKSIYQIENVDEIMDAFLQGDPDSTEIKDEQMPYWMNIWESAIALSKYIINNQQLFHGKTVIEIGAGLALPSLFAADFCKAITITDYLPAAVDFARKNGDLNFIYNASYEILDWRNIENTKQYDIILASDIAYEKRFYNELPQAINALLKPDGICLLAEPNRRLADDFLVQILPNHFAIRQLQSELINDKINVRILEIRKK